MSEHSVEKGALVNIARRCANPLGTYDEDGYCYWCGNHEGKAGHGYDCPLADALDPVLTPRSHCVTSPGVRDTLDQLDGTDTSAVSLISGLTRGELADLGGVPDERGGPDA